MLKERIDKIISSQGKYSRKDVKTLISQKRIMLNGEIIKDSGIKADTENDRITINGEDLFVRKNIYLMLNKPQGVVSATDDRTQKTVIDIVPDEFKRKGLFPAGRLDKDTTGFVLITDDGDFAHRILSPKNHVEKKYIATLDIPITEDMKRDFNAGIQLKGEKKCMPANLEIIDTNTALVTIYEGMYHQIKRMFGCYGAKTVGLHRISMGNLCLDKSLKEGECREITKAELQKITE